MIEASGDASSLRLKRLFIERGDVSGVPGADGGNIQVTDGRLIMNRVDVMNGTADGSGSGRLMVSNSAVDGRSVTRSVAVMAKSFRPRARLNRAPRIRCLAVVT